MFSKIKFNVRNAFSFLLIFVLFGTFKSSAQPGVVAIVAGGEYAKTIIKRAEVTATTLLNQADATGNTLLTKMGNELNVAAKNASLLLDKQLEKNFDKLNTENQKILNELERFRQTTEKISSNAFELKDAMVVDIKKVFGDILPWSKTDFYVQRINGLTQLMQLQLDYSLNLLGIGFGFNQEDFESKITKVTFKNKPLTFVENKISASESQLSLSREEITPLLSDSKVSALNINLSIQTRRKKGMIFKSWNIKTFELPITLTILPRKLSNVIVKYSEPRFEWQDVKEKVEYYYETPNHHQESKPIIHYTNNVDNRLSENQRFVNKVVNTRTPQGNGCPWTSFNSLEILEDGKLLTAKFESWGYPCTYYYGATIQEYRQVKGQDITLPPLTVEYGKNLVIELPKNTQFWQVQGKTIDFRDFDIIGKTDFGTLFSFQGFYDIGDKVRVVYKIGFPY